MTQVFDEAGEVSAATIIYATPMTVTQVKTTDKDGYAAVQVGMGARKAKNLSKAVLGHTKGAAFQHIREFRSPELAAQNLELGSKMELSVFVPGDIVEVSSTSKGKGFQGVVKRHGFKGGPRSHGQKNKERAPGSIGGGGRAGGRVVKRHGFKGGPRSHGQKNKERAPGSIGGGGRAGGRVVKGMRMAGRMGGDRVTVRNLKVLQVDADTSTLLISGAIPGRPGTLVEIRG